MQLKEIRALIPPNGIVEYRILCKILSECKKLFKKGHSHEELISFLREHKELQDEYQNTLLHLAAFFDDYEDFYPLLLKADLDLSAKNKQGMTPLQMAKKNQRIKIIELICVEKKMTDYRKSDLLSRDKTKSASSARFFPASFTDKKEISIRAIEKWREQFEKNIEFLMKKGNSKFCEHNMKRLVVTIRNLVALKQQDFIKEKWNKIATERVLYYLSRYKQEGKEYLIRPDNDNLADTIVYVIELLKEFVQQPANRELSSLSFLLEDNLYEDEDSNQMSASHIEKIMKVAIQAGINDETKKTIIQAESIFLFDLFASSSNGPKEKMQPSRAYQVCFSLLIGNDVKPYLLLDWETRMLYLRGALFVKNELFVQSIIANVRNGSVRDLSLEDIMFEAIKFPSLKTICYLLSINIQSDFVKKTRKKGESECNFFFESHGGGFWHEESPLLFAIKCNNNSEESYKIIECLIEHGADLFRPFDFHRKEYRSYCFDAPGIYIPEKSGVKIPILKALKISPVELCRRLLRYCHDLDREIKGKPLRVYITASKRPEIQELVKFSHNTNHPQHVI